MVHIHDEEMEDMNAKLHSVIASMLMQITVNKKM